MRHPMSANTIQLLNENKDVYCVGIQRYGPGENIFF